MFHRITASGDSKGGHVKAPQYRPSQIYYVIYIVRLQCMHLAHAPWAFTCLHVISVLIEAFTVCLVVRYASLADSRQL